MRLWPGSATLTRTATSISSTAPRTCCASAGSTSIRGNVVEAIYQHPSVEEASVTGGSRRLPRREPEGLRQAEGSRASADAG